MGFNSGFKGLKYIPLVIFPHAALEPAPKFWMWPLPHINLETHVPQAQRPSECRSWVHAVDTWIALGDPAGLDSIIRSINTSPGPPELCASEPSGHEAHVAAPSSVDVKNEWIYTSTPPYAFIS